MLHVLSDNAIVNDEEILFAYIDEKDSQKRLKIKFKSGDALWLDKYLEFVENLRSSKDVVNFLVEGK